MQLCASLLSTHAGDRLVGLDALTYAGNRQSPAALESNSGFRFAHGNICNTGLVEQLLREERIDTVVNFPAETRVDRSIMGPAAFLETNIVGTHSLLEAASKVWLDERAVDHHRFHHVSTDRFAGNDKKYYKVPLKHIDRLRAGKWPMFDLWVVSARSRGHQHAHREEC